MTRLAFVCSLIAVSQLALGALYLFAPQVFIAWQGLTPVAADIGYPLAMLAARFLVYGIGMLIIARDPQRHGVWLDGMIAIQAIDLAAGLAYTARGIVPVADAAVPMINAALFIALMLWVRPRGSAQTDPA